jgi:hypothetical protein
MGKGGIAPQFLTLALDGDEWSASRRSRFTPVEKALVSTGWWGTRPGLDAVE